ncbi:MAG: hypothetical protein IT442_13210, partial [Phycisphaeraceae bacterium]|nr:hypothetical protein [Phycisphaeraceae bacterium]
MSHRSLPLLVAAVLALPVHAALSPNLIVGGTFEGSGFNTAPDGANEDLSFLKMQDSPRTVDEVNLNLTPVRAHQFHSGGTIGEGPDAGQTFTDLGRWIGATGGDPSIGFTTFDNPRGVGLTPALQNRSIVTRNGQPNGVIDATAFRWGMAQFVPAPENVASSGTAQLDYDYFFRYWEGNPTAGVYDLGALNDPPQILQVTVWGIMADELPTYADRFEPRHDGYMTPPFSELFDRGFDLLYFGPNFNSQYHDDWLSGSSDPGQSIYGGFTPGMPTDTPDDQVWKRLSDGVDNYAGSAANPVITTDAYDGSFQINQQYDYFYVVARMVVYSESHPYFWLYGGIPTDTMSVAIDNVSLQVPLEASYSQYLCDFNLDGLVNVQDINPFVKALTNQAGYTTDLLGYMALASIPAGDFDLVLMAIDPTQDGSVSPWPINVQDINPFV